MPVCIAYTGLVSREPLERSSGSLALIGLTRGGSVQLLQKRLFIEAFAFADATLTGGVCLLGGGAMRPCFAFTNPTIDIALSVMPRRQ